MCSWIADERAAVDQLATGLDVAEGGVGALAGGSGGVAFAVSLVIMHAAARIVNTLEAPRHARRTGSFSSGSSRSAGMEGPVSDRQGDGVTGQYAKSYYAACETSPPSRTRNGSFSRFHWVKQTFQSAGDSVACSAVGRRASVVGVTVLERSAN